MKPYLLINPEHPGYYYALFYLLAFLTGFVLLMIEGRRRNFQSSPWMLVIATAFLFFMVGCRLITFSPKEWGYLMRFESIPYSTGRSVLGGILLCIPGILLAKKYLRFKADMMDAFALVLPLALVVERFGCLIAGCCYGAPSRLPWAIQYGNTSQAFTQHVHDGLLSADSPLALPVHPVQFYEVLCCVGIVVILTQLRKTMKAPGNLFLASLSLYGVVRFFLEFLRASHGDFPGNDGAFRLDYVQLSILLIVIFLSLLITHREKKFYQNKEAISAKPQRFFRPAFYFLLLGSLFLFVSRWLSQLEMVSLNIVLLPMLIMLTWSLFTWATVPRYRLATIMLPVGALLLMNQTLPEYSKNDSSRLSYNTVSLGWIGGHSDLQILLGYVNGGSCSGGGTVPSYAFYDNSYSAAALGIGRTVQQGPKNSISFGVNGFSGHHTEDASNPSLYSHHTYSIIGINPYVQFDYNKIGIGAGFTAGDFTRIVQVNNGDLSSVNQYSVYPSFNFRGGDLKKVFFEYKFFNQFPTAFPALNHQLSLGVGVGKKKKGAIRIGTASNSGLLISATFPIGEQILLDIYTGIGGGLFNSYEHERSSMAAFNMHFKFNKKETPK